MSCETGLTERWSSTYGSRSAHCEGLRCRRPEGCRSNAKSILLVEGADASQNQVGGGSARLNARGGCLPGFATRLCLFDLWTIRVRRFLCPVIANHQRLVGKECTAAGTAECFRDCGDRVTSRR